MVGSKGGTARAGPACSQGQENGDKCGIESPTGRRVCEPGREKWKEPSSWKEESEKSGKHGKQKRWSWRGKGVLGWLPKRESVLGRFSV